MKKIDKVILNVLEKVSRGIVEQEKMLILHVRLFFINPEDQKK